MVVTAALLAASVIPAGCSGDGARSEAVGAALVVYVGLPLHGENEAQGQALQNGMKLALAEAKGRVGDHRVEAIYLDDTRGRRWDQAVAADNARRASQDVAAIGYLGDLDSGATRVSLPITNQAEMVQISPASTAVDLTRAARGEVPERLQPSAKRTFARVVPADDVQAAAAASWAKQLGAKRVAVLSSGEAFGDVVTVAFEDAAREIELELVKPGERPDVVYVGGSGPAGLRALRRAGEAAPGARLIGSDALLQELSRTGAAGLDRRLLLTSPFIDPQELPPAGRRFAARYAAQFGAQPDPAAAYGYEAVGLLIDAIRRAGADGNDRKAVLGEALDTKGRRSILGTYSIDDFGDTTLRTMSGYRVSGGKPVFDRLIEAAGE